MKQYLVIISNPHDNFEELKIPFAAANQDYAQHLAKKIVDIWYPGSVVKSLENQKLVRLFEIVPIDITRKKETQN